MAVTGLFSLAENLLDVTAARSNQVTKSNVNTNNIATAVQDEFTSSTPNIEQAAGLFTVNQFSLFSAAAETLLAPAITTTLATPATANTLNADASAAFAATGANSEDRLQSLNTALDGLGLSNANISKIDRIADLTNDFNPKAFSILAHQLLAQQVPQDAAATTTAPAQTKSAKA
jgi:hypothetical protein